MLALFYFAIPVGRYNFRPSKLNSIYQIPILKDWKPPSHLFFLSSGLGYITGSEAAKVGGSWHWGLRVTPVLGIVAVILLLLVVQDPVRGEREGGGHIHSTSWIDDIKSLYKK